MGITMRQHSVGSGLKLISQEQVSFDDFKLELNLFESISLQGNSILIFWKKKPE
jgi:hypothetical protein